MELINETPRIQNQLEAMGLRRYSIKLNLSLFLSHLCFHLFSYGKDSNSKIIFFFYGSAREKVELGLFILLLLFWQCA